MMSYQLPDLLSPLNSLSGDDDDGDLHISPLYRANDRAQMAPSLHSFLQNNAQPLQAGKFSHLQRRTTEFLKEYNAELLASTLIPFTSFPQSDTLAKTVLGYGVEWLAVCALTTEEVLRPGRIIDLGSVTALLPREVYGSGSFWEMCKERIFHRSHCGAESFQAMKKELLHAITYVPGRPSPQQSPPSFAQEYVDWRVKISGHSLLFDQYFSSLEERNRFDSTLSIVLEICACVTDLFAYNIHQAWYSKRQDGDRSHLNLITFLRAADPEMTLQGAINHAGEMIQERLMKLRRELEASSTTKELQSLSASTPTSSAMSLRSSLSSLVSLLPASLSGSSMRTTLSHGLTDTAHTPAELGDEHEITRKILLNWVRGVIHWAYEADYFYPSLDGDDPGKSEGRKRKGNEVRDYGWVFLIKEDAHLT